MERMTWERAASILFCLFAGGALLFLFWQYLFPVCLPFLFAWLISLLIRPLAERAAKRLGLDQKLCAVVLLTLFLAAIIFLIGLSVRRLIQELSHLLGYLMENNGQIPLMGDSFDIFEFLMSKLGIHPESGSQYALFRERFYAMMTDMMSHLMESLSAGIPAFAAKVLASFPTIFFMILITVIAGFYFCMDGKRIGASLVALLPRSIRERIPAWKEKTKQLSWRYGKVYLLLLLITFAQLLIGFLILGVDYAFLLALLIAVLDMLPLLGVGSVLIPWALISFLQKNFFLGFGLTVLYLVMLILRQIMEPKLVGKSLGLHPLLALFAGYAGWRLFGLFGMLLGPVIALLIKNAISPMLLLFKERV